MASEVPDAGQPAERREETSAQAPTDLLRTLKSEDLFQGHRIIGIEHAGSVYRLQITARGKLILQK